MRKEKLIALKEEFPFLEKVIPMSGFNPDEGYIRIQRMDRNFLQQVPVYESYSSSAGESHRLSRLYAVLESGEVVGIPLSPEENHSTGYAYDKPIRKDGQTFLSSIVEFGKEFSFLVLYQESYYSYRDGDDEESLTILKPSKHLSIREEWERAIEEERKRLFKEADV